jgi:hypothetical protein
MATKSVVAIAAALVGGGAGAVIANATLEPEVVVETRRETVTETVTEEVTIAPDACIRALDEAERMFDLVEDYGDTFQDFRDITTEALQAAFDRDAALLDELGEDIQANNTRLDSIRAELEGTTFFQHAEPCRDAS